MLGSIEGRISMRTTLATAAILLCSVALAGPPEAGTPTDADLWIEALGALHDGRDESVLGAFGDGEESAAASAAILTGLLDHDDPRVCAAAAMLAARAGVGRHESLRARLETLRRDASPSVRASASLAVLVAPLEILAAAEEALASEAPWAIMRGADLLGRSGAAAGPWLALLLEHREHEEPRVRSAVWRALGRIGGEIVVAPFVDGAAEEKDPWVLDAMRRALVEIDPGLVLKIRGWQKIRVKARQSSLKDLIARLHSRDDRERERAADALARRDDPRIVPALRVRRFWERSYSPRIAVRAALAAHGDWSALRQIVERADDEHHRPQQYLKDLLDVTNRRDRAAWRKHVEELGEEGFRELCRRKRLPPDAEDANLEGFLETVAWFDGLGFPDLGKLPFVVLTRGGRPIRENWSSSGQVHGFLVSDDETEFTILKTDLTLDTSPKTGQWRIERHPADLDRFVREGLALMALDDSQSKFWGAHPFGEFRWVNQQRFRLFVLARACLARGLDRLAYVLWQIPARDGPEGWHAYPPWSLGEEIRLETASEVLRDWHESFASEDLTFSDLRATYRERVAPLVREHDLKAVEKTLVFLDEMVDLEGRALEPGGNPLDRARELVRRLPMLRCSADASWWRVFRSDIPDELPASELVDLGLDAAPALIDALDDRRPTRIVIHYRQDKGQYRSWLRILDVGEVCRIVLEDLLDGQSLSPAEGPRSDWKEAARRRLREVGDVKVRVETLISEVRKGGEKTRRAAGHLIRLDPARAAEVLPDIISGTTEYWVRSSLIQDLGLLRDPETLAYLHGLLESPSLETRLAASRALLRRGDRAGVESLLRECRETLIECYGPDESVVGRPSGPLDFLCGIREAEVLRRVRDAVEGLPIRIHLDFVGAIPVWRPETEEADRDRRAAHERVVESVLVTYLSDDGAAREAEEKADLSNAAAEKLARLRPERYRFEDEASSSRKRRLRAEMLNVWRVAHDLEPLPVPSFGRVEPLADDLIRPLIEAHRRATSRPARWLAALRIERAGPGALPAVRRAAASASDPTVVRRLTDLTRRLASTVRRAAPSKESLDVGPEAIAALERLVERPLTGRRLVALALTIQRAAPESAEEMLIRIVQDGTDSGVEVEVELRLSPRRKRGWDTDVSIGEFRTSSSAPYEEDLEHWREVADALDDALAHDSELRGEIQTVIKRRE
jgi:HEAT repeat protein